MIQRIVVYETNAWSDKFLITMRSFPAITLQKCRYHYRCLCDSVHGSQAPLLSTIMIILVKDAPTSDFSIICLSITFYFPKFVPIQ